MASNRGKSLEERVIEVLRPFVSQTCIHMDGPNRDMTKPRNAGECKFCRARALYRELTSA